MTPNHLHKVLVGATFAIIFQVHQVNTMDCGLVNFVRPAILGGTETVRGEWPFIVAIHYGSAYICGGTIISIRHILTAAHCIHPKRWESELLPQAITVRLGAYNLTKTNEKNVIQRNVSQIFLHHDWDPFSQRFDADIAILVLSENITFTNYIQPVCMPARGVTENMEGSVVGYGVRREKAYVEIPRRIVVRAVNSSHCFRVDDAVRPFSSERTFCGGNGDGSPDQGDSGGGYFFTPAFSWAQYGIVSALRTNDTGHVIMNAYNIYTNVTMFKEWIIETVNQTGGVVGEARTNIVMECEYAIVKLDLTTTRYTCGLFNIDINGNNFEAGSFVGKHLAERTERDVEVIYFASGRMSSLPTGIGFVFENILRLFVGEPGPDSVSLGTKAIRRAEFRNLKRLLHLTFYRNDIETLHEDALWDLPQLTIVLFIENKLKVLFNETFSNNTMLLEVAFRSNQLTYLPDQLFRRNRLLAMVDFQGNFLKTLDENLFKTNRRLGVVVFTGNQLTTLPRGLFHGKLALEMVVLDNNSLSSIHEDLFETNQMLHSAKFGYNRIETLPRTLFRNNLRLYGVDFRNNSIATIDDEFFVNNDKLQVVTFADNRLEHLQGDVFKRNSMLIALILSNNRLKKIDINFAGFQMIKHIDLSGNDCTDMMYVERNASNSGTHNIERNLVEFQRHVQANCTGRTSQISDYV